MNTLLIALFSLLSCSLGESNDPPTATVLPTLKISESGHYLETEEGDPFFWLGDTGWLLFSKLTREEAAIYLDDRATKGFNVIQVMLIHHTAVVNAYGDQALVNEDVSEPLTTTGADFNDKRQYDYWDHVEYIIDLAAAKNIYMALVPIWGSNVRSGNVNSSQAEQYARWLAKRFGQKSNIIWLNGGDVRGSDSTAVWNSVGSILDRQAPDQLITFHPFGRTQSSIWFHDAKWLDFNMFQSGHRRYDQDDTELAYGEDNWKYVNSDYKLEPTKPTLDGEPSYEGIPQGLHDTTQPYWKAADLRRYAYWSVFAGACGFTYGHNAVMQMYKPTDNEPAYGALEYWDRALEAEGAGQMQFLKDLLLSVEYQKGMACQDVLVKGSGQRYDRVAAFCGDNFGLFYSYTGAPFSIEAHFLSGKKPAGYWYNPRTGSKSDLSSPFSESPMDFDPPGDTRPGNDWALVLRSR